VNGRNALVERSATSADIIAWLQADHRLRAAADLEVDGGRTLDAETTVEDWRLVCNLIGTRRLASVMNEWFGTLRPTAEWHDVLEPEDRRTLGDLADYAAGHVRLPDFRPMRVAGVDDAATGAFFCLRSLLARTNPLAAQFRPSTPISLVMSGSGIALGNALVRLGPRVTPQPVVIQSPRQRTGGDLLTEGLLCLLLGLCVRSTRLLVVAPVLFFVGIGLTLGAPDRVELPPYHTLGDLSRAIANSRRAT
jgi:hypothetical protein